MLRRSLSGSSRALRRIRVVAGLVSACSDPTCGIGTVRVGDRCELPASEQRHTPVFDASVPMQTLGDCPSAPEPALAEIESAGGYCIDRTEVTQAQYQEFLESEFTTFDQSNDCLWNEDFEPGDGPAPDSNPPRCLREPAFTPEETPDHPVVCVDWCDAHSFCAWSGKHLCGDADDVSSMDIIEDEVANEWLAACSGSDEDGGDGSACNRQSIGSVASVRCVVEPGVYDLVGHVREWTRECEGQDDNRHCATRGGDTSLAGNIDTPDLLRCTRRDSESIRQRSSRVGFRCCAATDKEP